MNDNGKWDLIGGSGQEVVSTTGLDFPTAKVLKLVAQRANSGFALNRHIGMPVPPIGSSRFYRWYVRMIFPDSLTGNGDHPWQDGNAVSNTNWFVGVWYGAGVWTPSVAFWTPVNPMHFQFRGPPLPKGQTFRFECQLERVSTTTFTFHIRVFNSANALVADDDDFVNTQVLGGTLATTGPRTFNAVANLDGLNCGTNDFETAGNDWWVTTFDYSYQGGFAVVDDRGWIGPWGSVPGEQ